METFSKLVLTSKVLSHCDEVSRNKEAATLHLLGVLIDLFVMAV